MWKIWKAPDRASEAIRCFYFVKKVRGVKIGQILKEKQPDVAKKLNKKRRKKRRGGKTEHLSFHDYDRMMRERTDVDETKCRGR